MVAVLLVISGYASYSSYRLASLNHEAGNGYVSDEIYYVDSARRILQHVFHVGVNESMYSNRTNPDYFNLEHPPLGKYIIAVSILLFGDNPLAWRIPGVVEAGLIPFTLGLAFWLYSKRRFLSAAIAVVAASAAAADPILATAGSVAMLDIHLAFFTALSISLLLLNHRRAALVSAGLAAAVKMSGLAAVIGVILYDSLRGNRRSLPRLLAIDILIPLIVYVLALVPLAAYYGPYRIYEETIAAVHWHTTTRPPGPPTSTPIGWILNVNPFYYSFHPVVMAATLNTPLHLLALAGIVPLIIVAASREKYVAAAIAPLYYAGTLVVYEAVWFLGNKSLYSFYAVALTPPMAGVLASMLLIAERMGRDGEVQGNSGGGLQAPVSKSEPGRGAGQA